MAKSEKNVEPNVKPSSKEGKFLQPTPMLDELESGPWPSFITCLKELAERTRIILHWL